MTGLMPRGRKTLRMAAQRRAAAHGPPKCAPLLFPVRKLRSPTLSVVAIVVVCACAHRAVTQSRSRW